MTRLTRRLTRSLSTILAATLCLTTVANGQARPEERNRPPLVTLVETGEGVPVLLRWRSSSRTDRTIIVTSRTGTTMVLRPEADGEEPEIVLRGLTRPPMEKIWTVAGRMTRNDSGLSTASWTVVDGAARVVGVKGLARARSGETDAEAVSSPETKAGESTPETGPTGDTEPPGDSGPGRREPRDDKRLIGNQSGEQDAGEAAESLRKAMTLERISDEAVGRTGGAAIMQSLSESGLDPTSIRVRLPKPDRRADYEIQTLLEAMRLAEVQLPTQPVAPGASWTAAWPGLIAGIPVRTEITWTLVRTDEAARGTSLAETAVVRIEYRRRLQNPTENPSARERRLQADGRGEIELRFEDPLLLDARMVEQPVLDPGRGRSREVTRYRLMPLESR